MKNHSVLEVQTSITACTANLEICYVQTQAAARTSVVIIVPGGVDLTAPGAHDPLPCCTNPFVLGIEDSRILHLRLRNDVYASVEVRSKAHV